MEPDGVVIDHGFVSGLFSCSVATCEVRHSDPLEPLFESETHHIANAVEKRKREFQAGRHCARRALGSLGLPPLAIPSGADRSPCWPDGFVGSITHTGDQVFGFAAAAVAKTECVAAIGLDAETAKPLADDLVERILTRHERLALSALQPAIRGLVAKLCFSAKEAFYKCQYPLTLQFLGFHDVQLELDLTEERFVAILLRPAGRFSSGASFEGNFRMGTEFLVTGVEYAAK